MVAGRARDEDDQSGRYTEGGINVVALDRNGRGLHRARPERRAGSDRFPRVSQDSPHGLLLAPILMIVVTVAAAIGVAVWLLA